MNYFVKPPWGRSTTNKIPITLLNRAAARQSAMNGPNPVAAEFFPCFAVRAIDPARLFLNAGKCDTHRRVRQLARSCRGNSDNHKDFLLLRRHRGLDRAPVLTYAERHVQVHSCRRNNLGCMATKNSQAADNRWFARAFPADHLTGAGLAGTHYSSHSAGIFRSDWYRDYRMMFVDKT